MLPKITADQFRVKECIRYCGPSDFLRIDNLKEDGSLTFWNGDKAIDTDADTVITAFYLNQDILPGAL